MINYSANFGGFVEQIILDVAGTEFLAILLLLVVMAVFAAIAFNIPLEFTISIFYSPLITAAAYNSEFIKLLLILTFWVAVIAMKYLTFNK